MNAGTSAAHRPFAPAASLVRTAARILPAGEVRQRYRCELIADLAFLNRSRQLRYAAGVCSTAWSLRRELSEESAMNDTLSTPLRPLVCRLNLRHEWHWESTEDGLRFRRCRHCGKDDNHLGNGPLDGFAIG